MERDTTPEGLNPLGIELTQKIAELMSHPKNDMSPEFIKLVLEDSGEEVAAEVEQDGRQLLTAYRDTITGSVLYLGQPAPGSDMVSSDDRRWGINLLTEEGLLGDVTVVKDTEIRISEVDYQVSFYENIRYYDRDNNELRDFKRSRLKEALGGKIVDTKMLMDFFREEASLTEREYDSERHDAIMVSLGGFTPEQELLDYNPEI